MKVERKPHRLLSLIHQYVAQVVEGKDGLTLMYGDAAIKSTDTMPIHHSKYADCRERFFPHSRAVSDNQ